MRNYPAFPRATPHRWAGSPRVPHPSATLSPEGATFDLHALGTPPALILSQDQTLHQNDTPAPPKRRQDFVSRLRASSTMRPIIPPRSKTERGLRSDASVLHLRPPTRSALPPERSHSPVESTAPATNLSTCGAVVSARAKENRPNGRAALSLERNCVSAPIVGDDLQSDTLRSLARARFGACQHLLTEGDYRHARTWVSRVFDVNFR